MTFRKTIIDNSVRYITKNEKTKAREIKLKTTKAGSLRKKQNKNFSQNIKKFIKKILQQEDLVYLQNSISTIITFITHTSIRVFILGYK